jgi:hypothetical protein
VLACAECLRKAFLETTGCDASAGIAISHFETPLQDVVRAAQIAEKRAKRSLEEGGFNRAAVAVTLYTRSGETIEWGCKWKSGGLGLYSKINDALTAGELSAQFPQRVIELLAPYLNQQTAPGKMSPTLGFENVLDEIIQCEFAAVCARQRTSVGKPGLPGEILSLLKAYVVTLENPDTKLRSLIGLCKLLTFENRTRGEAAPVQARTAPGQIV